ncbi:MAG: 16S rRNA (guanine(527)-N(7))-methyltransferase RsmG [Gaiellaceae bacterium]
MTDLDGWIQAVIATPSLTAIRDLAEARRVLLEDSLQGVAVVEPLGRSIVDVGSGGGAPGIPIAASLPGHEVTLLEANGRKCDFLRRWAPPNAHVVDGRAEEHAAEAYDVAVAKALAPPPVAAEWCLPLVREGGSVVLWVGPSAERERVARVAERIAGELAPAPDGFLAIRKIGPTPVGFPRRVGVARKRPLA